MAMIVEWVLLCELKMKVSRNINSTVTRHMRECLIQLYCIFRRDIKTKKEVRDSCAEKRVGYSKPKHEKLVKEENMKLRKELDILKGKIEKKISTSTRKTEAGT